MKATAHSSVQLYPNPSNGQFTLIWQPVIDTTGEAQLEVRDVSGRIVFKQNITAFSTVQLDLTNQKTGIYYYQLQVGEQAPIINKIIIQ